IVGAVVPGVLVILGFRRFAWIELLLVVLGVGFLRAVHRNSWVARRGVARFVVLGSMSAVIAIAVVPSRYSDRITTANPFAHHSNRYAANNQSHLDDIADAWDIVKRHPLFGLGVGTPFTGNRTEEWKGTGSMVHNGPLHVW